MGAIRLCAILVAVVVLSSCAWRDDRTPADFPQDHLRLAKIFLAAGDYRRAIESCQRQIDDHPSAESYVYLTYVYQAIDGYLEHLAKTDQWLKVEQVYLNLASNKTEDLADPPSVMARIAKEMIQGSVRDQADVAAAMAVRLDKETVNRRWQEQTAWRTANPDSWWFGVPDAWGW
jgi:tetratricopeptide (TPR) repeat protein